MQVVVASGRWFDGRTAAPNPVTLRLGERLEIIGATVHRDWSLIDLRAGQAQPPLLRLGILGDPGHIEVVDEAFVPALVARCPDLRKVPDGKRGTFRIVLGSMAAGFVVVLTILFGLPKAAGLLAPLVPDSVEARLGAAVEGQVLDLLGKPLPCTDPAGLLVLDRLVTRLVVGRGLPADLRVTVRLHGTANAMTLPGARVVVLSRLIETAVSADEFAGVLAHELGHVAVRDPTRALIQASGTSFLLGLVLGDLTGSTVLVAIGQAVLTAAYSRDAERAADDFSVNLVTRAGGNGAALASILERIAADGFKVIPEFLRSHPFTRERATMVRTLAGSGTSDRRILDATDWSALRGICRGTVSDGMKDRDKTPRRRP